MSIKKLISQAAFDELVLENIDTFDLNIEDAIGEAIDTLRSQAVDTSLIVKDPTAYHLESGKVEHKIVKAIESLKNAMHVGCSEIMSQFLSECNKDSARKYVAAQNGAYDILLNEFTSHPELKSMILICLGSLMKGQPDLLDERGLAIATDIFKSSIEEQSVIVHQKLLIWLNECCVKHEQNRQKIMTEMNASHHLTKYLSHELLVSNACSLIRNLVLDDDIRVEFGKAHEHAKIIAENHLPHLIKLLKTHDSDVVIMNDVMTTISTLLVRNEFCEMADEEGVLEIIFNYMRDHSENERAIRKCLKLIQVLARNDGCKTHVRQKNGISSIVCILRKQKKSINTTAAALQCVSALTLRCPENSSAFFEHNAAEVISEVMHMYKTNEAILRSSSWAIRNMVSKNKSQGERFLALGVEELLKNCLETVKDNYDFKAALRDLGCDIKFKEEWTGRGGKITTQQADLM